MLRVIIISVRYSRWNLIMPHFARLTFWLLTLLHLAPAAAEGLTRTHYIAAEEVLWDYAPSFPLNPMRGKAFSDAERVFVEANGSDRIGRGSPG